jgi:hypothetical protein
MPVIKPRTRGKRVVRHIVRLDQENNETLHAYAEFIAEPTDYVLNQLVDAVLGKDREFVAWRELHRESFVPQSVPRKRNGAGPSQARAGSLPTPATRDSAAAPTTGKESQPRPS